LIEAAVQTDADHAVALDQRRHLVI
jgi:hypothetical protein